MNTDDRELLELAAKAIGRRITGWNQQHGIEVAVLDDGSFWQPLSENHITDCMGDALRLAVRLSLTFRSFEYKVSVIGNTQCDEYSGEDPYAATRRAIVRAAADIGRQMTSNGASNCPNE